MNSNQDNYHLGRIPFIKKEINSELTEDSIDNNNRESIEELNENVRKYYEYFTFNEKNGFLCKYKDCEQIELFEDLMISHVSDHLIRDQFETNTKAIHSSVGQELNQSIDNNKDIVEVNMSETDVNRISTRRRSDRIANHNKTVYVCEWKGCQKTFTYLASFESHKSQHMVQEVLEDERKSERIYGSREKEFDGIQEYIEVFNNNRKALFGCKWKKCDFKTCLAKDISKHIRNEHLKPMTSFDREYSLGEHSLSQKKVKQMKSHFNNSLNSKSFTNFDETLIFGETSANSQIPPIFLAQNIKTETDEDIEIEVLHNSNVNVSISESNVLLSCKGLASASKVAQYFDKKVIDGKKFYFCKFKQNCQFRTHLSQKIAEHINIIHIGCEFKCHKPNCNKVFKTPHTWRQHQKNHICGFGIYGYGKNVIGVCKMDNINKYNKRIIVNGKRSFQCTYNGCNAILTHRSGIKRHIHNQHICPYRINLHVIRNCNLKSEQTQKDDNLEINSNQGINKMFECKRVECKAKFSVYSDLLKHENVLCKYKKETKNINSMQKIINKQNNVKLVADIEKREVQKKPSNLLIVDNRKNVGMNSNERIECNLNESKKRTNSESTLSIVDISERKSNADKYYVTKLVKGVNYHLCQWNDCKFTTKFLNKIVEHIEKEHLKLELQSESSGLETNTLIIEEKGNQSSNGTHINKRKDYNSKTQVEYDRDYQKLFNSPTNNNTGNKSEDNINEYIEKKNIDCEPNYFCKWNECKYYTNSLVIITQHIKETHIRYTCGIDDCQKSFRDLNLLKIHENNHICGFNIEGRKPVGVCDLDNIRKYRNEKVVKRKYVYTCKWIECDFISESRSYALSHIHNRHICPNRITIPTIQSKSNSTIGQKSEIKSSKSVSNQSLRNQNEFICKRPKCEAKFNSYSDLLNHENLLCNFKQYHDFNVTNEQNSKRLRTEGRNLSSNGSRNQSTP